MEEKIYISGPYITSYPLLPRNIHYEPMLKNLIFWFLNADRMFFEYLRNRKLSFFILSAYLTSLALNAFGLEVWLPSCPIYAATGHECLGCGTNRALISMLHLDFVGAWHFNKLIFLYLPIASFFLVKDFYKYLINFKHSKQNTDYGKI